MLIQNELIDSSECFEIKSRLLQSEISSSSASKVNSFTDVSVITNGLRRTQSNFFISKFGK